MKDALHGKPPPPPGSALQGIANPSIYGTKEDLYDRLRRHQYQGSTNAVNQVANGNGRPKGDTTSDSEDQGAQ